MDSLEDRRKHNMVVFLKSRGKRYHRVCFDNFEITDAKQQEVVNKLKAFGENIIEETEAGNGVVLYGPSGTGKDHLITALARNVILNHGGEPEPSQFNISYRDREPPETEKELFVRWKNGMSVFADMRDGISRNESEDDFLYPLIKADILILSDPLPPEGELTRYQRETLYRLLDARYSECRPTWCTLNVASGGEAGERMGVPCYDRLRHGALCLYCNWPSYRKAKS
ncbi:MAG: ATP-binding protein [Pirellulales bacterium]|nr:ATP-binding protein [Pirellulales bacterium]